MSKCSQAESKAGPWCMEYLAMGPERSLEKLAADARRIASERGWSSAPSKRTLETWSKNYDWSKKAHEHDREVIAQAHEQLLYKRADQSQRSEDRGLGNLDHMQRLAEEAVTVRTERIDPETGEQAFIVDGKGDVIKLFDVRPKRFDEMPKSEISSFIALTREAGAIHRALLGDAQENLQVYRAKTAHEDPESHYFEREAKHEIAKEIGTLLREVEEDQQKGRAQTARAEAERQVGLTDEGLELTENNRHPAGSPAEWQANNPGLVWEMVPDDEL